MTVGRERESKGARKQGGGGGGGRGLLPRWFNSSNTVHIILISPPLSATFLFFLHFFLKIRKIKKTLYPVDIV